MKTLFSFLLFFTLSNTYLSAQSWNLIWSDEFDGAALNTANWQYDIGTGEAQGLNGWGNNELQYYRTGSNNLTVADGVLSITARAEPFGGMDYTSARIKTAGLQFWEQGKIEARIKLPTGQGIWPAFWMLREDPLSDTDDSFYWPGEIDIVETVGHQPTTVHGTAHYGTPGDVISSGNAQTLNSGTVSSDYHLYSIEWYEDLIVWKLDGVQFHSLHVNDVAPNNWLFDHEYYMLLNVAVGGDWPGSPDGSTVFPVQMDVDYVRVYQLANSVASVTFNVDMRCESDFSSVGLVGPSEALGAWCGDCIQLTDSDLDGIWSVTLDLPPGNLEYKYNVDNWAGQENLVDDVQNGVGACAPITDGAVYANRLVTIQSGAVFDDTYGTCGLCDPDNTLGCMDTEAVNYSPEALTDDGSCAYAITFQVDMSDVGFPYATPELNGVFNGWCGNCNPMTDMGNGIWETTVNLVGGLQEFKFSTDEWTNQEELAEGASCTLTTDGFTNRSIVVTGPTTYGPVAWEACPSCIGDLNGDGLVNIADFIEFNSAFGSACSGCPSDLNGDGIVGVDDFLILNSLFGNPCD